MASEETSTGGTATGTKSVVTYAGPVQAFVTTGPANTTAISDVTNRPVAPPPPVQAHQPVRVAPKLDVRRSPPTDDFYPPAARRAEVQGVTTVRACVSSEGKTEGEPTVQNTSGNASLDEAALKWAKRARWAPGTEDGKPATMCSMFNVRFKLTD